VNFLFLEGGGGVKAAADDELAQTPPAPSNASTPLGGLKNNAEHNDDVDGSNDVR